MKRIISVVLSVILIAGCLFITGGAYDTDFKKSEYPLIVCGGYSSAQLCDYDENGSEKIVWWMDIAPVLDDVMKEIMPIIRKMGYLDTGDYESIRQLLRPYLYKYLGFLQCDRNGRSVQELHPHLDATAEASRWANLEVEGDKTLANHLEGEIDENNTFVFGHDFRMGAEENARRLSRLVDDVLKTTGAKKVNIVAQSYGGQLAGTYISLDPEKNGKKVNNLMMAVPALGGATLAYDILSDQLDVDVNKLIEYLEYGFLQETDFHLLFEEDWLNIVNELVHACYPDLLDIAGYWPSIWDFVPYEHYRELIEDILDPAESKDLIAQTTRFHETYMAKFGENFKKAQAAGTTISIMAGMGIPAVTGSRVQSDGIIPVTASTGATCAPYGKRFADGYSAKGPECARSGYTHISPSMEVDASTCYLPDNTWLIDGYFHGLERMDEYTRTFLLRQALSANPIKDIYETAEYPQFHTAASPAFVVHAKFDSSPEGYVGSKDSSLILKNDSTSPLLILDIAAKDSGLKFKTPFRLIRPGETASVSFEGTLPKIQKVHFNLTVTYQQLGTSSFTPFGQRIFDFTIKNGGTVNSSPYRVYEDNTTTTLPQAISLTAAKVLDRTGIFSALGSLLTILMKFVRFFETMTEFFKK